MPPAAAPAKPSSVNPSPVAAPVAPDDSFRPALAFSALTPWFDVVARVAVRDAALKDQLADLLPLQAGQVVLDVGCGTGTLLLRLHARQPQARLYGVDADPTVLTIAKRKAAAAAANLALTVASATRLPFAADAFDAVTTSLMLHHLTTPQKRQALAEIRRVLRPGGVLLAADYDAPRTWLEALAFLPIRFFDGFDATEANVQGQLPALMHAAGLKAVTVCAELPTAFGYITVWRAQSPAAVTSL
ncbi:MAG: class I SAM-dependent methyltransferase [Chloracidobacterium sp.]|nr:class I SAM-dependent methyltransferase [Chloracidobacterium sp.]MDW8217113.1 methyltransferase domain-containing protein [Acidobacteriota bacterium]